MGSSTSSMGLATGGSSSLKLGDQHCTPEGSAAQASHGPTAMLRAAVTPSTHCTLLYSFQQATRPSETRAQAARMPAATSTASSMPST